MGTEVEADTEVVVGSGGVVGTEAEVDTTVEGGSGGVGEDEGVVSDHCTLVGGTPQATCPAPFPAHRDLDAGGGGAPLRVQ